MWYNRGCMTYLKALLVIAVAKAMIYAGLCFLSGQLLSSALREFYAAAPGWVRMAVFTVIVGVPANLMISWGFQTAGVTFGAVTYAAFAVLGAVVTAVVVDGATVKLDAGIAFAVMLAGAAYGTAALRATVP